VAKIVDGDQENELQSQSYKAKNGEVSKPFVSLCLIIKLFKFGKYVHVEMMRIRFYVLGRPFYCC